MKRILVPLDGSEASETVLGALRALIPASGARVTRVRSSVNRPERRNSHE